MLSQEDIRIITDIVATQISLGIAPLEERLDRLEKKVDRLEKRMDVLEKKIDALEKRMDALEKRMDVLEKKVDGLEKRVDGLEKKVNGLEKKMEDFKSEIIEKIHDFEDTVTNAMRHNNTAMFGAIRASEEKLTEKIEDLQGSFQSTIHLVAGNTRQIHRIQEHIGLYPIDRKPKPFANRVAQKRETTYSIH